MYQSDGPKDAQVRLLESSKASGRLDIDFSRILSFDLAVLVEACVNSIGILLVNNKIEDAGSDEDVLKVSYATRRCLY